MFLYGMGAESFVNYAKASYGVVVSKEEAKTIRDNYFKSYPELNDYYDSVSKEIVRYGYIENPIGRRKRVFSKFGDYDRGSFINAKIQGFASDLLILALLEISELPEYNNVFQVIGTVHDSILMYVRKDSLEVLDKIVGIMEAPKYALEMMDEEFVLPIKADVAIFEERWYGPKYKRQEVLTAYKNEQNNEKKGEIEMIDLRQGDCLEVMKDIPDGSVDMILCDLPYGVLNKQNKNAKWDSVIPFEPLWEQYKRIIKYNGAIVLFGSGMFTSDLIQSNRKMWKYNLIWKKGNRPTGFLNAKKQPLRIHEDICVFYKKQPIYNPQFTYENKVHSRGKAGNSLENQGRNGCYGNFSMTPAILTNEKYPISIIDIDKEHQQTYHPTQKPVALLEYLIKTYTNEGETVLDNAMGSGSTGVACKNTNRNFIGIELDEKYFKIAEERISSIR